MNSILIKKVYFRSNFEKKLYISVVIDVAIPVCRDCLDHYCTPCSAPCLAPCLAHLVCFIPGSLSRSLPRSLVALFALRQGSFSRVRFTAFFSLSARQRGSVSMFYNYNQLINCENTRVETRVSGKGSSEQQVYISMRVDVVWNQTHNGLSWIRVLRDCYGHSMLYYSNVSLASQVISIIVEQMSRWISRQQWDTGVESRREN